MGVAEEEPVLAFRALSFPFLHKGAERGDAGARPHHDDGGVGVLRQAEVVVVLDEYPYLAILNQPIRQIGGGCARAHGAIFLWVAHHADGQVYLLFHLALAGGYGVEARREGTQQPDQLLGREGGREAFQYIHHLGRGD